LGKHELKKTMASIWPMSSVILGTMEIRQVTAADLDGLAEIDATIESTRYLHVDRSGEAANITWRIDTRSLRTKLLEPNRLTDEQRLLARQIATGADDGAALAAEHDGEIVALLLAQPRAERGIMKLIDLRVDFEHRRQGLASGLVYQLINEAREAGLRAVAAESRANNFPASEFLAKLGFELSGIDTHRYSNHDLVKEAVTLFWYLALN
jgi:ribosomal protein S18 acetylase RimI-like enzyme